MRRVRLAPLLSIVAAVLLAGCGDSRMPAPDTGLIPAPSAFRERGTRRGRPPPGARELARRPGHRAAAHDGRDRRRAVAVWRYKRTKPLPRDARAAERRAQALVAQVESRDKTFE